MGLASKEKLWQVSLLLVEHLKRNGLVPGKFVYDEICSVSRKAHSPPCGVLDGSADPVLHCRLVPNGEQPP